MSLILWRFTDSKPGHDSQSSGLCKAFEEIKTCECIDILPFSFLQNSRALLFNQAPSTIISLPEPDFIIGAGHGTHLSMLSAKKLTGGKLIVLMKPSLPYSFFDFCIVPEHDSPPIRDNIISTKGAINPVSFNPNKNIGTGLILLGGPSEHFGWDEANIIKQVEAIIKHHKNIKWTIADSPRTPATTLKQMEQLQDADFAPFQQTPTEKLREIVYNSATIWVSADSVSMIYESLSSGARVGVLDVLQKKEGRISNAINTLTQDELVTSFSYWDKTKKLNTHNPAFNEASRIAAQVLNNGTPD